MAYEIFLGSFRFFKVVLLLCGFVAALLLELDEFVLERADEDLLLLLGQVSFAGEHVDLAVMFFQGVIVPL